MPQRQVEYSYRDTARTDAARVLAVMFAAGALLLVNGAWLHVVPGAPVTLYRLLAVGGLLSAGFLAATATKVAGWALQLLLALYSTFIAVLALVAVRELAVATLGPAVIATGMFAGYFLTVRPLVAQVLFSVVTYVVCAMIGRTPLRFLDLLTTLITTVGAAVLLFRMTRRLRRASAIDSLTGVLGRSGWFAAAEATLRETGSASAAVVLIDFDDFKRVNDDGGHAAGDGLLRDVAGSWNQLAVRHRWVLGRYGGDEFVVLIPQGGLAGAEAAVASLRAAHPAAWTAGITIAGDGARTVQQLVQRADAALLDNKRARRS